MLQVGNGELIFFENCVYFMFWVLMVVLLMVGNDFWVVSGEVLELFINVDVFVINQDLFGRQGCIVFDCGYGLQVWVKLFEGGDVVVVLLN